MIVHTFIVADVLDSVYFSVAFCWGWVAVCALRGKIDALLAMAITMTLILLIGTLVAPIWLGDSSTLEDYYSLALLPGLVSWVGVMVYVLRIEADMSV